MNERPHISDNLINAFQAWEAYLKSGKYPGPERVTLGSLESNCATGKYNRECVIHDEGDINLGQILDAAFSRLTMIQRVCVRVHVLFSWCSPLTGLSCDWSREREKEANKTGLTPETYEENLISAIAELERACG